MGGNRLYTPQYVLQSIEPLYLPRATGKIQRSPSHGYTVLRKAQLEIRQPHYAYGNYALMQTDDVRS